MADPEWTKIKIAAGMYPDEAPGEAEAFLREGSWIRDAPTADDKPASFEIMGGWERVTQENSVTGKVRKILQYATNTGYPVAAFGTHLATWALSDGVFYFTTPIVTYGTLTNAFSTTLADATVEVDHVAHGRVTGDYVNFPESPVVTGGGITLTSGKYAVTKVDADTYTIEGANVATATVTNVGGTVDYEYFLAGGNEFGLGGSGFGTGLMGAGLYGRASTILFAARTWTFGQFGQNIIAAPRGGGVYEGSPYFTAAELAELVTNGTFTGSATGWTLGANWAYGANAITATASSAAATQSLTVTAGTWNVLKFNITGYAAGSLQPSVGGTNVGSAISANGRYFLRFWGGNGGAQTLAFTGTGLTATLDNVSAKILGTFAPVTNAPSQVGGVLVTPQGHVEVWGCVPTGKTAFDPMCLKRSDDDEPQDWTIGIGSDAGEDFLYGGSAIVTGIVGGDRVYYLTTALLWERSYRGAPTLTFASQPKGQNCGCIGINAATYADGKLWWMGNNKTFWVYDGTQPKALTCSGTKWVFDNIQFVQQDLIQCWHNAAHKEIWWQWPDRRDGTNEISRYATYNYKTTRWNFGSRVRSCIGEAGSFGYPIGADASSSVYFHEKGDNGDGGAIDGYFRTGAFDIGDGNTLHEISGFIPDVKGQSGSYSIRFRGYEMNDQSTPEDTGALPVAPGTTQVMSFFVQGRQSDMEVRFNDAPMTMRWGHPRILLQDTGNQF